MRSRRARAVLAGLLGAACALRALLAPCYADDRPRVSVVAGARGAMAHRLSQELEAAGLSVRVEATEADAAPGSLVVVVPAGDGGPIEIWSSSGGRAVFVARVAPEGTVDTRVLRVTELVRALALPAPPPHRSPPPAAVAPARPEPAPTPIAPPATAPQAAPSGPPPITATAPQAAPSGPPPGAWAEATPPLLRPVARPVAPAGAFLDIGVAIALGIQAPGASMALDASLRIWPHARVGLGLFAKLPIIGAKTSAPAGSATFRPALFGVELATAPVARTGRFGLVLSPGVGFCHMSVSGDATPPYHGSDVSAFAAMVYGRSELRFRLADSVRLTAGGLGGAALPPIGVRFADREISTFRGHVSFSLGVVIER